MTSKKSKKEKKSDWRKDCINGSVSFAIAIIIGYALLPSLPKKERAETKRILDKLSGAKA